VYTQHIVLMNTHTLLLCIAPQITVLGMTGLPSTAPATPQTTIMEPPPQRYAMLPTTQTTLPTRELTTVLVASSFDGPSLKPEA
jgi:hypothetical protein